MAKVMRRRYKVWMMDRGPTVSRLPGTVWALGIVSLLMDASSELVHALLPLLLVGPLGAGMALVGLIEGLAEATASITKVFSGAWSDRIGRRRPLLLAGYGLAALSKPVFPLAGSALAVLAARCLDRFGKGIRGAPRDALIADVTAPAELGAAYGLRQALDSAGAFLGPMLAMAGLWWLDGRLRAVLWWGVVPAALAVLILLLAVREPPSSGPRVHRPFEAGHMRELGPAFWVVTGLGALFTLARFSEAFLVLRALSAGMALAVVPAVMVAMNLAYALGAYPAGRLADRLPARGLLALGLLVLAAADLLLARAQAWPGVLCGAALWGLHMALTQGLFAKLVADVAPAGLRGTAFGFFNVVTGVAALGASALAGLVWSRLGPQATFAVGGLLAVAALGGLPLMRRRREHSP
jgi:MFS family permease